MIDIKAAPFNLDDEGVKWVEETKQNMTLEEKIGQLMIPIGYSADPGYLAACNAGSPYWRNLIPLWGKRGNAGLPCTDCP